MKKSSFFLVLLVAIMVSGIVGYLAATPRFIIGLSSLPTPPVLSPFLHVVSFSVPSSIKKQ